MLILASLVVREDHYAKWFLSSRPMDRLGVISYGIYLYHTWIIWILAVLIARLGFPRVSPAVMFFLTTAATILVCEASFRLIEEPLLHVKERRYSR